MRSGVDAIVILSPPDRGFVPCHAGFDKRQATRAHAYNLRFFRHVGGKQCIAAREIRYDPPTVQT
jgi:hypothetical protein